MKCYINHFNGKFSFWWLRHLLWNCPQLMVTGLTDDKSTLGQVMAWCRQATSHHLTQCWPRSMPPYGFTRPQWVKYKHYTIRVYHGNLSIAMVSRGRHGAPKHLQLICLFNIPGLTIKAAHYWGHRWLVDSLHKGQQWGKRFHIMTSSDAVMCNFHIVYNVMQEHDLYSVPACYTCRTYFR